MSSIPRKTSKKVLGGVLGSVLVASGFYSQAKKKMLSSHNVTGLFFHNPTEKLFLHCIRWLKANGCTFLSSDQLVEMIQKGSTPPPRSVWISLDDGWKGNLSQVIPSVMEYNVPITIFISTNPIEKGFFWFDFARKYSRYLPEEYRHDVKKLWSIPETKRKQIILSLEQAVPKPIEREAMSIEDIKSLSRLPQVTIGAHGVHHALLANCNSSELDFELKESKSKLEEWTGKEVKFFAYPHGSVNNDVKEALQKVGFTLAATLEKKPISVEDDPYFIPRYGVNDEAFFPESICQIVGVWWKFLKYFPFF